MMKLISTLVSKLNLLIGSLLFFKNHFPAILGLGLIAAFGRVIQLGGFGDIPIWANIILEGVVETSRILIFLFVLGVANIKRGADQVKLFFSRTSNLKTYWAIATQRLKTQWLQIFFSFFGFLVIVVAINFLIDLLAYETCLFLSLKREGILVDTTSEWTILLFFKNILVIPFTFVFETIFLLWITNNLAFSFNPSGEHTVTGPNKM